MRELARKFSPISRLSSSSSSSVWTSSGREEDNNTWFPLIPLMDCELSADGSSVNKVRDFWAYPCGTGSVIMTLYLKGAESRQSGVARLYTESCRRIFWSRHNQSSKDEMSVFALLYAVLESAWTNISCKGMGWTAATLCVLPARREGGTEINM